MSLLWLFIILTTLNVIIGTIKSIATIKGSKLTAAIINALAYAVNTAVIFITAEDALNLWVKLVIVATTNFVGVYIVKLVEERRTKDKLWKIECTIPGTLTDKLHMELNRLNLPHSYITDVGRHSIFNIYAATKEQSSVTKKVLLNYDAKYFVSEGRVLD